MKRRIAEIVTKFSTEGLGELRRAIRDVSEDTRRAQAANGTGGVVSQLRGIGSAAKDARRHTSGLKADLSTPQSFVRGLREIRLGFGGIGREIAGIGRTWKSVDGKIGTEAARSAKRLARAFGDVGKGLARSLTAAVLMGSSALGKLGGIAGGAAGAIVSAFTSAGKLIAKTVFSRTGIIGAAIAALGASAYSLLTPALGLGAVGVAGLAGWWTSVDLKEVRQASESLGIPVDLVQQWQFFGNTVDVTIDEISSGMETLKGKITESLDPTSDSAKLFRKLGLQVRDMSGQMMPLSNVMLQLAAVTQKLSPEGRGFALENLLGDPTKFSELMRRVSTDWQRLESEFLDRKARGIFASPEEIERISKFRVGLQDLFVTFKAFARELFTTFIPVFEKWGAALEGALSMPQGRADLIQKFFVKPFQRALQWIKDFSKVFFGFDIDQSIFGTKSSQVINTWMITLKQVLDDVWRVAKGLGALFLGLGKAILSVAGAFDDFVLAQSGVSISDWLKSSAGSDTEAFFRDLGDIAANAFTGAFPAGGLRTSFGQWIGGGVEALKAEVEPIRAYIAKAMSEVWQAGQNGTGLSGVETMLGKTIIMIGQTIGALAEFGKAFYGVFFGGEAAPAGYEFLDKLKSAFDFVLSVVLQIEAILAPLIAQLGPEGIAKVIVAKLGLDLLSKIATPAGLLAGATAGSYALLKNIMPGKATNNDTPETNAEREARDRSFLASGGPKPALRQAYEDGTRGYETRDRSLMGEFARDQEARIAREAAAAPVDPKTVPMESVSVIAQGVPLILNLAGVATQAILPYDQVDGLVRAAGSMMGGR